MELAWLGNTSPPSPHPLSPPTPQSHILHYPPPAGGSAAVGDRSGSWTVADVAELPPPGQVAEGPGEVPGEDHQAAP